MKKQALAVIMACAGAVLAVLIAKAAEDCGIVHPNGCAHRTVSGTEACDTGAQVCDGATYTNCATTTGKTVLSLPKEVDDNHNFTRVIVGSSTNWVDCWTGHHFITTTQTNCSQVFGCTWVSTDGGKCVKNPNDQQGWHLASLKTSNQCQ
ncbi:MAG: hypothetical protein M1541_21080 [Acidobacteria bacterium]|nr:hypothetical protein [Acidobacteriota bacterium]